MYLWRLEHDLEAQWLFRHGYYMQAGFKTYALTSKFGILARQRTCIEILKYCQSIISKFNTVCISSSFFIFKLNSSTVNTKNISVMMMLTGWSALPNIIKELNQKWGVYERGSLANKMLLIQSRTPGCFRYQNTSLCQKVLPLDHTLAHSSEDLMSDI